MRLIKTDAVPVATLYYQEAIDRHFHKFFHYVLNGSKCLA